MKIIGAAAYRQFQPFSDGPYRCRGQTEAGFDSTILRLDSDSGLTGWGEMAPLGTFYSEAFAAGVRAAMPELLPKLLGADPRQLDKINQLMDQAFFGQPYLKAPLDMACWDLAGQAAGLPLAELTGGRFGETVWLYRSVSQDTPERMVETARRHIEAGYRRLQVKVGGDPLEDATRMQAVRAVVPEDVLLLADANGAWQLDAALRFAMALGDMDYYLEQPCMAMADNARLAANLRQPLILDE
ncbi:MAG: mandelate racemase/muconate lactonizing enzyme family protein, partial [Pseudomonadota bacterium]